MKYWVFPVCTVWTIGKYFFNTYYENIFWCFCLFYSFKNISFTCLSWLRGSFNLVFVLCVWVLPVRMDEHRMHVWCLWRLEVGVGSLGMELEVAVSQHVGSGKWSWVPCKNSALSHGAERSLQPFVVLFNCDEKRELQTAILVRNEAPAAFFSSYFCRKQHSVYLRESDVVSTFKEWRVQPP